MNTKNQIIKIDVLINPTLYGEYQDKTIICNLCKQPKSVALIFDKRICIDCLSISRTYILREAAKIAGITHKPPPYTETPSANEFKYKKENI